MASWVKWSPFVYLDWLSVIGDIGLISDGTKFEKCYSRHYLEFSKSKEYIKHSVVNPRDLVEEIIF